MQNDFFGNMGEPETPDEFKRKYGVYPPGYDQKGKKLKSTAVADLRLLSAVDRKRALQRYRKLLLDDYQSYVRLIIGELTGVSTIETVDKFDQWVKDTFSD